ncbi:MAG TPA: DUF3052 domain-containing protein [Acidimicrobiales bacterium]|nr:DUF3052 domain-containing protein [Acidimicrobiales bacterium]
MVDVGYSGTPLQQKLGMKPGHRVAFPGAPEGFDAQFVGVEVRRQLRGPLDVIVVFAHTTAELGRRFPAARKALADDGGLWVAWPKKASKVLTDLSFEVVQPMGLAAGLVDNKVCAIDEVWSGLRFVYRLRDRTLIHASQGRSAEHR